MSSKKHTDLRVKHNAKLVLDDISTEPDSDEIAKASEWGQALKKQGERLDALQSLLHAGKSKALLLVLQGMDTSGKDGVIRSVFTHVSPLGVRAEAFGAPSEEEKRHDFLWRIHQKVPALGEMAIFNRSHYEDVLVTRVRGWIEKKTWGQRFQHIRDFETMLQDSGVTILKCFLHISKGEQKKRLQARLDDPSKHWKLQASDFEDRKLWGDYMAAYQDAMSATSTPLAPWYVIPADRKPYRDLVLAELLVQTLEGMALSTPKPQFDLSTAKLR
jgi:PPK2 family polyphosphate:nucleotide phosphotransferase